jgi:hypothetical protein
MKKYINASFFAGALLLATSCATSYPGMVTDNKATKTGEATVKYIWIFGPKDADLSIEKICKKAGITKVSSVDYKFTWVPFVRKYSVIVTGN